MQRDSFGFGFALLLNVLDPTGFIFGFAIPGKVQYVLVKRAKA
jgi:hypothetical protein